MDDARLIYISGMAHSGSTLLDLACSSGGCALSLGEIRKTINLTGAELDGAECSCGAAGPECDFWAPLHRAFPTLSEAERYEAVLAAAARLMPGGFLIDSSKSLHALETFAATHAPLVLHIHKDVRAYIVSKVDNAALKNRTAIKPAQEMRGWRSRNMALADTAERLGLETLPVSYELLCLKPKLVADRINAFAGRPLVDPDALLGSTNHHIMIGNRMRLSHGQQVRYDPRWMARDEWVWPYALNPAVRRYNHAIAAQ